VKRLIALLPLVVLTAAAPSAKPAFRLAWPVDCVLGRACAIQNYVDDDPGPAAIDYDCKHRTYADHNGVDIRLISMALERRGVNVLAAAPGQVLRLRDDMADRSIRDQPAGAVAGRECGNGLVIAHADGWETQYCHMRQGSLVVHAGQQVGAGTVLGQVGLSGDTEFPHLHITVRKDGKVVDPFAYGAGVGACHAGQSLWAATPPYREGEVLVAGFATGAVTMQDIQDNGADQPARPSRTTPLVAFVQAIGLEEGDRQHLALTGPDGAVLAESAAPPLDHDKAQQMLFVGRGRVPPGGWPAGEYRASYQVTRNGRTVLNHIAKIQL
jgi:murein DD-endopeptidase MepM/ murein hydrolase activator NlpD